MKTGVKLTVNGRPYRIEVEPHVLLVDVLREKLGLTGTKKGCGTGECGACTVLVDGEPVNSCLFPAVRAEGRNIVTIEGLGDPDHLHPLQKSFVANGAVQCGFCTPGMILSAKALLDRDPDPGEDAIRRGIAGNICRCTGYVKIVQAIREAAAELRKGRDESGV